MPAPDSSNRYPSIVQVMLDVPLDRRFDYINPGLEVQLGNRVVVPFAGRQLVGIVAGLSEISDISQSKLRALIRVFDDIPLDTAIFKLLHFCADYYHTPIGQVVLSALPLRLRQIKPAITRTQWAYRLVRDLSEELGGKRQIILARLIAALQAKHELSEAELKQLSSSWRKVIQPFVETGAIQRRQVVAVRPMLVASAEEPNLNEEQKVAIEAVLSRVDYFQPWLLYGVTGSGKTEVYIRLMQAMLTRQPAQVLVMVPEINLTPQLEARFRSRLRQFNLVALHSHLSESDRLQNWQAAQSGAAQIIIGTRLSVFTPLPYLKLMILDEEHDSSYKQQDGMRYHARDVALMRAKQANIPIILGSATPSLESWHNATSQATETKKTAYGLLKLTHRAVVAARLPRIMCLDTSKSLVEAGLTPALKEAIHLRLERGEQSLLFINRRGYAPVLHCSACQWLADCRQCSAKMVLHLSQRLLRCHHCGAEQVIPKQCPSCGNPDLRPIGQATQRIEETLQQLYPQARIARVDRDAIQSKDGLTHILSAIHHGELDILVGTQMLAKGHDFPNLTLVGVLDTDSALYSPDYRASERLFAQLMQVAGRAGRGDKAGEVLIQTDFPQHPLFTALKSHDYANFADALIEERKALQLPPASYIALFKAEATEYTQVESFLKELVFEVRHYLSSNPELFSNLPIIYDPVRPSIARLKRMERAYILMQSSSRASLQTLLKLIVDWVKNHPAQSRLRWVIDVDATDL